MRSATIARLSLLLAIALFGVAGCKKSRSHHAVVETRHEFLWDADVKDYTAIEEYEWETFNHDAFVEFEAFDFRGVFTVEVFDHFDGLVYADTFFGDGGYRFSLDLTELGEPGIWYVVITSEDVDGFLRLSLY